jgi:hypothetical protein
VPQQQDKQAACWAQDASLPGMPAEKASQGYNHMMSGGVAGSFAVLLLHPFDVIKTRLQGG